MNSITVMRSRASTVNPRCAARPPREELVSLIPKLRAFSHMLCLERGLAETLAQKAFATAWYRQCHVDSGTNLTTGLFRIFHEEFHARRKAGETQLTLDLDTTQPSAEGREDAPSAIAARFAKALAAMSDNQREALILISAGGFTCEDAATICGAQPKTVKSRAARARNTLIKNLESAHAPAKSGVVRQLWTGSVV